MPTSRFLLRRQSLAEGNSSPVRCTNQISHSNRPARLSSKKSGAANIIVGFAHVGGQSVGIVAHQPAVLAVVGAFLGSRLVHGNPPLSLTVLVIGWAAFWPGIVMCLSLVICLVFRTISVSVARPVCVVLGLVVLASPIWYIVLSVKAIRAINRFATWKAVQAGLFVFVILFFIVLVQYIAGVR